MTPLLALAGALVVSLSIPVAWAGPTSSVVGRIERSPAEVPLDSRHKAGHLDDASTPDDVALIADDGRVLLLDAETTEGLATGTRVKVSLRGGRPFGSVAVISEPVERAQKQPKPQTQVLPYAIVAVSTPRSEGSASTIEENTRWLLEAAQPFFDREAPGAFKLQVHSTHSLTLDSDVCETAGYSAKESTAVKAVRQRLNLPNDVGVILTTLNRDCSYAGKATLGAGQPGQWVVMNYMSPLAQEDWSREFYEEQGREVMIHEIGHNLGLSHSQRWECETGSNPEDPGASGCVIREYGSYSSIMGAGPETAGLDAHQRWQLGIYGRGRMLSVEAGSGSAILLDDQVSLAGADAGVGPSSGGLPVVRALHLRDSRGEAWVVARTPMPRHSESPTLLPGPGVVVSVRTTPPDGDRAMAGHPVQADTVKRSGTTSGASLRGGHDILEPGSAFITPGGTRIVVGQAVTTAYGKGFTVSWQGATTPPVIPSPPALDLWEDDTSWIRPGDYSLLPPEDAGEYLECAVITSQGKQVASWSTVALDPVPGSEWREGVGAWAPSLGRVLSPSWRLPLAASSLDPYAYPGAEVTVVSGASSWVTRCQDFQGRILDSSATIVRADGTAPVVASGDFTLKGLVAGPANAYGPEVRVSVSVPAFRDDESGLRERVGACERSPADQVAECVELVGERRNGLGSAAEDRVGNSGPWLRPTSTLTVVRKPSAPASSWYRGPYGVMPLRNGATATYKVKGRQAGVITACGPGTGAIRIAARGKAPVTVDLRKREGPACVPIVVDIIGASALTVTYVNVGSPQRIIDGIGGVAVLR